MKRNVFLAAMVLVLFSFIACGAITWQGKMEDAYALSVDTVDTVVTIFKDNPKLCPAFPRQCEQVKKIALEAPTYFRQLSDALTLWRQIKNTGTPDELAKAKAAVEVAALKAQLAASEASAALVDTQGGVK